MSVLNSLNVKLSQLKAKKREIEADLKLYRQRKKDVEELIRELINVVDNKYGTVNKYGTNIINNISSAVSGSKCLGTIASAVSVGNEKGSGSDGNVVTALNDLKSELSRVNQKINDLNSDLIDTNNQISSTNAAISAERSRLAAEAARKAAEAAAKAAEKILKK